MKKIKKNFWGYALTIALLFWAVFAMYLMIDAAGDDDTQKNGGVFLLCVIVEAFLVGAWTCASFEENYVEIVKFRITSVDKWSHDTQKYITRYFVERVELYEKYFLNWKYGIYLSKEKPNVKAMAESSISGSEWDLIMNFESKEKSMEFVIK